MTARYDSLIKLGEIVEMDALLAARGKFLFGS